MKILYAATVDVSRERGDSLHFAQLAYALQNRGHELTIVARGEELHSALRGLDSVHLVPRVYVPNLSVLVNDFRLIASLKRRFSEEQFDLVYQRGIPGLNQLAKKQHTPSMVEVNGIRVDELAARGASDLRLQFYQWRERRIVHQANKVVCVTPGIKRQLVERYGVSPERCAVIANAADTQKFTSMPRESCRHQLGLDEETFIIGFVGTFQSWIDFDCLLDSLKILVNLQIPLSCILIGSGPRVQEIEEKVLERNLQNNVSIIGRITHREIPLWINAFDVCVAPFTQNRNAAIGLSPLKLYEYMACERPVVATAIPGITELIDATRGGFTYPAGDHKVMANFCLDLYRDKDLREAVGKRGRHVVVEHHSWQSVARRTESIMVDLCNSTSQQAMT